MRSPHWLIAGALAVLVVIAVEYALGWPRAPVGTQASLDPAELRPGLGPATFGEALAKADREIAGAQSNLERFPGEWLRIEEAARALMARYRLTARAHDLAEADRLLDRAMELAPWPAGPALSRAAVSLAKHDLDGAERALARFDASATEPPASEANEARSMRCEIAYQRGSLGDARRLCGGEGDLALILRRANLAAKSGDASAAARLIEGLLRRPGLSRQTLATLSLQRASLALAAGDWRTSGQWVRAAQRTFPDYWLGDAYLAQQYALEGNREEARRRYAVLAERTGDADVLDALARLAAADGRADEAQAWAERAGVAWRERNRVLPLAYAAHYSEHLLLNGNPRAALELAAADYRRRPHPATIIHYAFALWRNGQPGRALEVVREAEDKGFLTADLKLVEAIALGALGRASEAGEAMAEARRLNPRIDSARQQFVAFTQD